MINYNRATMDTQRIISESNSATDDLCKFLEKIPTDIIHRIGEEKLLVIGHIHIMYTVQDAPMLIHASDLIKSEIVSQKNILELFKHFVEQGMTKSHAEFTFNEDQTLDLVFTREGMKFLNDNVKPFEELINIYLSALEISE